SSNPATNHLIVRCPGRKDVEAVLALLETLDVPPVQVKIDCVISELYADATLDWETTIEIGDLLGEDITAGGSARLFGADVLDLLQESTPLPAFPGASLREVARAKMGLKVGYSSTKHEFMAVVDILESRGYLKVLMNPTLEIVNGRKAKITSSEHVPLDKIFLHDREGFIETKTEYVDVIDSLEITPHVFADGYIGLETTAIIGSKSIPDGVKQIRIVSKREIYNQENRIRPGESLVIGGIRKSEEHAVVRGVPFLKDIPLIGILFSSKDYEDRAVETMFILTPTISSGGIPNQEMVEDLRRKHKTIDYSSSLQNSILDPFDTKTREKEHALKLQELEREHFELVRQEEQARRKLREARDKAEFAAGEAEKAKQETLKATSENEKLRIEVEKLKTSTLKSQEDTKNVKQ
ncbi:MAG: type II secretion system protein GspD, partial [Planctomycetota bacterium]